MGGIARGETVFLCFAVRLCAGLWIEIAAQSRCLHDLRMVRLCESLWIEIAI